MSLSLQSHLTGGLYPNIPTNYAPLIAGGAPITLNPTPTLNPSENPATYGFGPRFNLSPQQLADLTDISTIRDTHGNVTVPTADGFISVGDGHTLEFDTTTRQGRLSPALDPGASEGRAGTFADTTAAYTGADCRLMIESAEPAADGQRYAKQLLEATTITVSIHREVAPVRAGGYINPKGFALGKRTIAGTLILTQGTVDAFLSFLQAIMLTDGSKDTTFTKVDQLPPFNITMIFTNEAGYASQRKLLGVKFVTDGVVYSIQDMLVEQTVTWMATDFTPLMPLTLTGLFNPTNAFDPSTRREKTPTDLMSQSR